MKGTTKFGNSMHLDWSQSCQGFPEEGACQCEADRCHSSSGCSTPPCTGQGPLLFLQPPPVRARTVCCLLKIAPEPEPAGGLPAVVWATSFSFSAPGWSCGTPGEAGEREKVASISIRPTSLCAYKVLDQRGEKHEAVYRILPHT